MIGVITVLALLALALTPFLVKQYDRIAGEKETAQLKAFADAFRQGIRAANPKYIPNETGWAQLIAATIGASSNQVLFNERGVARVFLIDPVLQIGTSSRLHPAYTNFASGADQVLSPRLLILSSISRPFPSGLQSGIGGGAAAAFPFNSIWDAAEGKIPNGSGWSTWGGKGDDLKAQRINLADLFLYLTLNTDLLTLKGNYAIDEMGPYLVPDDTVPPYTNTWKAYFMDSTLLDLYSRGDTGITNLQYREILHRSKSFTYSLGSWQGEKFLGKNLSRPGPLELQRAASLFLSSSANGCSRTTPINVYNAMVAYMSNYWGWVQSGCIGDMQLGHHNPSGLYGDRLSDNQNVFGSQAYLDDQSTGLICQQAHVH